MPQVTTNPLSQAYCVDLHLHTSYSLDNYLGGAMGVDPDTPYRFARGEVVDYRASLDTGRAFRPRRW